MHGAKERKPSHKKKEEKLKRKSLKLGGEVARTVGSPQKVLRVCKWAQGKKKGEARKKAVRELRRTFSHVRTLYRISRCLRGGTERVKTSDPVSESTPPRQGGTTRKNEIWKEKRGLRLRGKSKLSP